MGEVSAVDGSSVEVNHGIAAGNEFFADDPGESRTEGTSGGSREEAIEIATVREVARAIEERGHIKNGHGEQGTAQALERTRF